MFHGKDPYGPPKQKPVKGETDNRWLQQPGEHSVNPLNFVAHLKEIERLKAEKKSKQEARQKKGEKKRQKAKEQAGVK